MNATLILLLLLPPAPTADADKHLIRPKMGFPEAMKPYEGLAYDYSGHVDATGKVIGKGLGCSAFTSIVLHRMRDGDDWLKHYDTEVFQWYGDRAATHFGLTKAGAFLAEELLDAKKTLALIEAGRLKPGTLYLFNARKHEQGHVGFTRLLRDGKLEQAHFSSMTKGLYRGDFREWLQRSMYRDKATIEFFVIPEP